MAGYLGSVPVPQATQHRESFTCTEGQTSFATAGYTAQFVDVYLNGSHLSPADFTATNGSDVVLAVAASADDVCDIISYTPFEVADQTFTGTTTMDVAAITGVLTTTAATVFNGGFAAGGVGTFADGSAGAPSITNTGDVNTGTFFPAADAIGFSTGGTERMRVTTDNLLLSQTAPSQDFGDGRVFISMKGRESADYSGVQMANYGTTGNDQNLGILAFWDGTTSENARISALRESATTDAGLRFYTRPTGGSLTERVRIDHDGDVGIGGSSTGYKLHLFGDGSMIRMQNTGSGTNGFLDLSVSNTIATINANYSTTAIPLRFLTGASESMRISSTGAVTMPLQPAFQVKPTSAQNNIALDSLVTVVFGTEVFDQNADFASNTFTAPVTGKYQLNALLYLINLDSASEYYYLRLTTSNRVYDSIITTNRFSADAGYATLQISVLADMDASDTAYVSIVQQGGTAQTDIGSAATNFSGYLVA